MLTRNTDARGTYVLFQYAHPLYIFDHSLKKGQCIIFDHITVFIDQQHAQIMNIDKSYLSKIIVKYEKEDIRELENIEFYIEKGGQIFLHLMMMIK